MAEELSSLDDLLIAQMDGLHNDVPSADQRGLEPEGYPTIILYTKTNKRGLLYDGSRDHHDLVQFVHDARAGKSAIGGLAGEDDGSVIDENGPDENDGVHVEL